MELHCINRVELRGFVGTSKVTSIGDKKAVRFSLATNYAYRDKEGCPVIEKTWHNCFAWTDSDADVSLYSKGTPLRVEGRIRNIRYTDASGCEVSTMEIVVSKVERAES